MVGPTAFKASGQALHDLFREVFALQAALSTIMDHAHLLAGLSTSQHKIMRVLTRIGPATVPDIATALGVSRQFVQTVCNQMLADGLIAFAPNPRHRRSQLVGFTERGQAAFQQARRKENRIIEQVLPGIDAQRAADACSLLEAIRKALPDDAIEPEKSLEKGLTRTRRIDY
jgi:DNA-binding MarR family transcriptional regulator